MVRMVIAEPDELLLLRMSGQFSRTEGLEVVGTARDCSSALDLVRSTRPDVVLVDLFLPPLGGVALIAAVKHAVPDTRVVALVSDVREATLQAAYSAGAVGYVSKDGSAQRASPGTGWSDPGMDNASRPPDLQVASGPGRPGRRFTTAGV
jgi:DNA-binding NarL/FixJ family response regulator